MSTIGNVNAFLVRHMNETKEVIEGQIKLKSYPFYYGDLDAISCEDLLRGRPNGTYLIRDGERPNQFYLSWVIDTDQCHFEHFPFAFSEGKWVRKNLVIGSSKDIIEFIPFMMHLSTDKCFPLNKN